MKKHKLNVVILSASIAALAGLLFGYDTGVISGAILFVKEQFPLTTFMTEIIISAVLLGAAVGALISGHLADFHGRRPMMLAATVAFIVGSLGSAVTTSIFSLIISRVTIGLAIGLASFVAPLYISEIAPKEHRGALVILNTIAVTGGIVAAYIADLLLAPEHAWRWMFGIGVIPALLLACGILLLPESPRWAAKQNRINLAKKILHKLHHPIEASKEFSEIIDNIKHEKHSSFRDLFAPRIRTLMLLGMGLAIIQQVTGINTILYYAPTIFKLIGFKSTTAQLLATLGMGLTNFIMTIIALFLVDQVGRRRLLLIGLAMMTISLTIVAFTFHQDISHIAIYKWSAVISLIIFVAFYAISIGCLFWLIIAEIYPLNIRGLAMSIAAATNWIANLIVALTFLTLITHLGPITTFAIYALAGLFSWLFSFFLVPETKQVSLECIEANLRTGKPISRIGEAID